MNTRAPLKQLTIDGRAAIVISEAAGPVASYGRGQSFFADLRSFEAHPRTMSRRVGYHVQFQDNGELRTINIADARRYVS